MGQKPGAQARARGLHLLASRGYDNTPGETRSMQETVTLAHGLGGSSLLLRGCIEAHCGGNTWAEQLLTSLGVKS